MREQLLQYYQSRHADFLSIRQTFPEVDMAGPFLMSPNELYAQQPNPLLIIGQETNGWQYHLNNLGMQMDAYEDFNVGINYVQSPFWNVTRNVEHALGNQQHSCAWTNLSKFDVNCGRPLNAHAAVISSLDNILEGEISIVKPKICIFFTGPNFDDRIANIFQNIEYGNVSDYTTRQLCQLKHPLLPILTYRTYHPRYLRQAVWKVVLCILLAL